MHFRSLVDTVKTIRRAIHWQKYSRYVYLTIHLPNKIFTFRRYANIENVMNSRNLTIWELTTQVSKWEKDLERNFIKDDAWTTNKIQKCSTLFGIRKMPIKMVVGYHYSPTTRNYRQKTRVLVLKQLRLSELAGGDAKRSGYAGELLGNFLC